MWPFGILISSRYCTDYARKKSTHLPYMYIPSFHISLNKRLEPLDREGVYFNILCTSYRGQNTYGRCGFHILLFTNVNKYTPTHAHVHAHTHTRTHKTRTHTHKTRTHTHKTQTHTHTRHAHTHTRHRHTHTQDTDTRIHTNTIDLALHSTHHAWHIASIVPVSSIPQA